MISTMEKRTIPFENNINLLDVSFSSYLNDSQDSFIRKLQVHSNQTQNPLVPISPQTTYITKKKVEDGEIGIFGAEKYFTGAIDEDFSVIPIKGNNYPNSTYMQEKDQEVVLDKRKARSATPSVRSEASWNSRHALLQSQPRNTQHKEANKMKSFFANLGCNCNGKSSVKVNDKVNEERVVHTKPVKAKSFSLEIQSKKLETDGKREECFSFPAINPPKVEEKEVLRNSLEVFGSPIMEKANKSFSLERKLNILNWDGVTPRVHDHEYDSESDASSDLFEIESFSTNGNTFQGISKPSNGYAPSEASIDWSVATASAADVSVISAYKEIRNGTAKNSSVISWNMKSGTEQKKPPPGILSGCKSQKSVRVAGDEYMTKVAAAERAEIGGSPRRQLRLDSATPITKFQAEAKLTGFDSRSRVQNGFGARPLPRSHTPHTSHLLYIQ